MRIWSFAVIAAGLALTGCATSADRYFRVEDSGTKVVFSKSDSHIQRVAILPFKAPTDVVGSMIADILVTELIRADRYELIEQGEMGRVLDETELSVAGLSSSKAAEAGSLVGADGVIVGSVDEYSSVVHRGRTIPTVGITMRLIECGSNEEVWSAEYPPRTTRRREFLALPEHARAIVHRMVSSLYAGWKHRRH